jgi:hypothetical protein
MAERAHPEDPAFQGTAYERASPLAEPSRFPNERTTYLPYRFSAAALASYGAGNHQPLLAELQAAGADSYERAGADHHPGHHFADRFAGA